MMRWATTGRSSSLRQQHGAQAAAVPPARAMRALCRGTQSAKPLTAQHGRRGLAARAAVSPPQPRLQVPNYLGIYTTAPLGVVEAEQHPSEEARAVGALLGAACGCALGAPVQHERHYQVTRMFPEGLTQYWPHDLSEQPVQAGHVTGEFELLLAVAHSLVAAQVCDVRQVASALAERCELSRRRYASPHIRQLLTWLQAPDARLDSLHWLGQLPVAAAQQHARSTMQTASSSSDRPGREPWGTADNTAAAAVPPLAVAYRAAPWPILESAVQEMCMVSHSHPIGIDGARVIAATMHWLLARASPTAPSPAYSGNSSSSSSRPGGTSSAPPPDIAALLRFLETEVAQTADMKGKLAVMRRQWVDLGHVSSWRQAFAGPQWAAVSGVAAARLSHHGLATSGTEAAVVAVWALITSWGRPAQAVCVAAALGGSVPVTTQLVGALAGAAHGDAWIPAAWIDGLENGGVSAAAADVGADGDEQQELGQEDVVRQDKQDGAIDADVEGGGLRDEVVAVAKQLACMRCSSIGLDSVSTVHQ